MASLRQHRPVIAAMLLATACSSTGSAGSATHGRTTGPTSAATRASSTPSPTTFTSAMYRYSLTVPAQWLSRPATKRWDGNPNHGMAGLTHDAPDVDQFIYSTNRTSWALSAPWKQGLGAYAAALVAANRRYHGDTCPAKPASRTRIRVGGSPGVLLAYDCGGALIQLAGVLHDGVGYRFGFRDTDAGAASDPTDDATFRGLLASVRFLP